MRIWEEEEDYSDIYLDEDAIYEVNGDVLVVRGEGDVMVIHLTSCPVVHIKVVEDRGDE